MLFSVLGARAAFPVRAPHQISEPDTFCVSLITCAPGPEVYQLFGHSALRVQRSGIYGFDLVYNYGVFSFSDDFVFKFTQGHTDYMLAVYDFDHFIIDYIVRGSTVYEQKLNLTQEECKELFDALCENAASENRIYRYNFLFDNCATRPRDKIEDMLASHGEHIEYTDDEKLYTFRELIRHYAKNYSWLTFGIDLALGRDLDRTATWREHMFIPMLLHKACGKATIVDSDTMSERPLVSNSRELYHSDYSPVKQPTPWFVTPMACAIYFFLFILSLTAIEMYYLSGNRWIDTILGIIMCISGLIIYFLVFASEHPATSFNIHALWLTPFAIIPAVLPYIRKARPVVYGYHIVNILLLILFVVLVACGVQCIDWAVLPLIGVSALRSFNFIYHYKRQSSVL